MGLERLMQFAMLYMTERELEQAQHEAVVAHQKYEQSRKTASGHIRVATQNHAAAVFSSRVGANGASGDFSTRKNLGVSVEPRVLSLLAFGIRRCCAWKKRAEGQTIIDGPCTRGSFFR